jgi:aminoglycoside phosphotransferase (APT) family kinase protein
VPVPQQRDVEVASRKLEAWLLARRPGARDLTVSGLHSPAGIGFSNETLMFDARWDGPDGPRGESFVARVAPTTYKVFADIRFREQYQIMKLLSEISDVPLPPMHDYEDDPAVLGAPFFVMGRIDGRVPTDVPSYHAEGWLADLGDEGRAQVWWSAVDALIRVHKVDPAAHDVSFLDQPAWGRTGIDQQLGYYEKVMLAGGTGDDAAHDAAYDAGDATGDGAGVGDPGPVIPPALAWLREHQPAETDPPRIVWGDARIGNIIFGADNSAKAVLDWEMVTLGQPEIDLAWFLFLDRHHCEGWGVPRLSGLPGRQETVAAWEAAIGRPARDLFYYEVFAAMRFSVIMLRITRALVRFEMVPAGTDMDVNNAPSRLLAEMLGLPAPGPAPTYA